MTKAFDQLRAMYSNDEQLARDLFEALAVTRLDLQLQQALRRRAEDRLALCEMRTRNNRYKDGSQ